MALIQLSCIAAVLVWWSIARPTTVQQLFALSIVGVLPLLSVLLGARRDVLRPSTLVPAIYCLYMMGPVLGLQQFGANTYELYARVQLVGMAGLVVCGALFEGRQMTSCGSGTRTVPEGNRMKAAVIVVGALGVVGFATQVAAFGGLSQMFAVGYGADRFQVMQEGNIFGAGLEWLALAGVLGTAVGVRCRSIGWTSLSGTLFLLVFVLLLLVGARGTVTYVCLFALVIARHEGVRWSNRLVALVMIIGVPAAQFYSLARYYLPEGMLVATTETVRAAVRQPDILLPAAANEFRAPSTALLELLEYMPDYRIGGASYVSALVMAVPGAVDGLDLGLTRLARWRLETFHPQVLADGGGLGFSALAEGWVNFGWLGVFVHLGTLGLLGGFSYWNWTRRRSDLSALIFAGVLPLVCLDALRIDGASVVYKAFRVYLVPAMVLWLLRFSRSDERASPDRSSDS